MAFTKVTGPGVSTTSNYRVGILTATKFVGPMEASGDSGFTNINVTGIATIGFATATDAWVGGATTVGFITATDVWVSGAVTATTYYGSGANLTGIGGTEHVRTASLAVSGISTFSGNVIHPDGVSARFGTDGDNMFIVSDGTNNFIHSRVGDLYIRNNVAGDSGGDIHIQALNGEESIICNDDGAVQLYFDNNPKFETTSDGIQLTSSNHVTQVLKAGGSTSDLQIQFKDSSGNIESAIFCASDAGDLRFKTGGTTERLRIDSSGRTGFGVVPNATFSENARITIQGTGVNESIYSNINGTGIGTHFTLTNGSSARCRIGTNGTSLWLASNNNSEQLRLDPNGRLLLGGIGNTESDIRLYLHNSGAAGSQLQFTGNASGTGNSDGFRVGYNGSGGQLWLFEDQYVRIATHNLERLRIDNTGKVLIATTTTSEAHLNQDELIIGSTSDDANHGLTIVTPSSKFGTVAFSDGSSGKSQGLIEYNHSGDYMRFYVNAGSEKLRIGSSGQIGLAGANYGSSGQVLTSAGSGSAPTWTTISGGAALTGSTNNQITTVTGANAIQGEANLTFDGSTLTHKATNDLHHMMESGTAGYCRIAMGDSDDDNIGQILYNNANNKWDITGNAAVRVEIESDGDVKLNTGNLIIGTAGKGIDFSVTANTAAGGASTNSELLDDYEEGTWTPADGGGIVPFNQAVGKYVKIGKQITCWFYLKCTANVTSGANAYIVGLPYTSANENAGGQGTSSHVINKTDGVFKGFRMDANTSLMYAYNNGFGYVAKSTLWDGDSTAVSCYGQITYRTA